MSLHETIAVAKCDRCPNEGRCTILHHVGFHIQKIRLCVTCLNQLLNAMLKAYQPKVADG